MEDNKVQLTRFLEKEQSKQAKEERKEKERKVKATKEGEVRKMR